MNLYWGLGMLLQGLKLELQFGMGMKKIKVYILIDEGTSPKCTRTMKGEDGESLADLRVRLEENDVLKFEFQYQDPDERCRVTTNLASLNDHEDKVFMIHSFYKEVEDLACKRQHLGGEYHFMDTIHNNDCVRLIKNIVLTISLSKQLQINIGC